MRTFKKRYIVLAVVLLLVVGAIATVWGIFSFLVLPLEDGVELADGRVIAAVDRLGPIKIGAYLFSLENGGFGLIDATGIPMPL